MRPGTSWGYCAVKIPTYTWKAWSQTSIDVIRLALFTGSRANDGEEPSWEGWSVIRNLSSKAGWTRREPKSTNSFWMILLRIFGGIRASIGRVTDKKTSFAHCVPGSKFCSTDREARTDWTPSWTAGTSTVLGWQHVLGLRTHVLSYSWLIPQSVWYLYLPSLTFVSNICHYIL